MTELFFITYSNQNNNRFKRYLDSCIQNNINPIILGLNDINFSFHFKILYFYQYLLNHTKNDIFCFTDSWDVILLANKNIIKQKFLDLKVNILFSVEDNYMYSGKFNIKKTWKYKDNYLNSGGYIGYKNNIIQMLEIIIKNNYYDTMGCDQSSFYNYFYHYPQQLNLDINRDIFGTVWKKHNKISRIFLRYLFYRFNFYVKNKNLYYKKNNNQILICHQPGNKLFTLNYLAYLNNYKNNLFIEIFYHVGIKFSYIFIFFIFYNVHIFSIVLFILLFGYDIIFLDSKYSRKIKYFTKFKPV